MNTKPNLFLGLQLPSKIDLKEIKDLLFTFNQKLKSSSIGNINTATLHKKSVTQTEKTLLIISIQQNKGANFDEILKLYPQLKIYKRYLITDLSKENMPELETITFEQFNKVVEDAKLVYYPADSKPNCIIKAMYHHFFSLAGDIIWYNGKSIHLDKGKYYARQLYCELFLDCIKTNDGYKIPTDAVIHVTEDNLIPQFQNKQIILNVQEEGNSRTIAEVMTNQYKIALN